MTGTLSTFKQNAYVGSLKLHLEERLFFIVNKKI
jgi:hypothetical protein